MVSIPPRTFPNGCRALGIETGFKMVRIHDRDHQPIWFGPKPGLPPAYRFDAPNSEYRTLYAAATLTGAFVETVLRKANRIVSRAYVDQRRWSVLQTERPLNLAQMFGDGLIYHGVTADISAGDDYRRSQALARDLYTTFSEIDGIAYRARHNNDEYCFALFDRVAPDQLTAVEDHAFSDHAAEIDRVMAAHGAVWDGSPAIPGLNKAG